MKTVIHVNQFNIKHNNKCAVDERKPVITVKTYKDNTYCNELDITDNAGNVIATLAYSPDKKLNCGAAIWVTVDSNNVVIK